MIRIPSHIQRLKKYKPGKPGKNLFSFDNQQQTILSSNENNLGPSPKAMEAMKEGLSSMHLYPDPTAEELTARLSEILTISPDHLIFGNGSDGLLYCLCKAFISPGEEILTSEGSFVAMRVMANIHNVPMVCVPQKEGYTFDLEAILSHINDRTKIIYLVNPNNPTGTMIREKELEDFITKVPSHILVVVDEAYFEYASNLSEEYPDSTMLGYDHVLTLRTFSKAYGLAGLRLGYGIAHPLIIDALKKARLTFEPNAIAQIAGLAALDDRAHLEKSLEVNTKGLNMYYSCFDRLGIYYAPSFANFVMIDLGTEAKVEQTFEALKSRGLLTRRLASFGLPHCMRISVGTQEESQRFVKEIEDIFQTELLLTT